MNFMKSIGMDKEIFKNDMSPELAETYKGIADCAFETNNFDRAKEYYMKASTIKEKMFGSNHDDVQKIHKRITECDEGINK
jgi:hypothetical protein